VPVVLVHAFQCHSATSPTIASTRTEIIRGFIPLIAAVALLHALAALALPYTSIRIDPNTWLALLLICAMCSAAGLCCLRLVYAPAVCTGMALFWVIILAGRGGLMLSYITSSLGRSFPLRDSVPVSHRPDARIQVDRDDALVRPSSGIH
jgi:hypothetical protein